MSNNVRPGDRAIMIRAVQPENVGAIVEVVREYVDGEILPCHRKPIGPIRGTTVWVVESLGRPLVVRNMKGAIIGRHMVGAARDEHLRRLPRPDEMHDMKTEERERSLTR